MDGRTATEETLRTHIQRELPHLAAADAEELARLVERLIASLQPEEIHLFGSRARGDANTDSDFDLLIVVPKADEPLYRLDQAAHRAMGSRRIAVDVIVMPREEFERRARAVASLPATVLREGKRIYAA